MIDRNMPGVSLAIIKDSEVTYMQSFGFANIETNTNLEIMKYLGKHEILSDDLLKFGEKIKTIWHYQLQNENTSSSYAFYLTHDNKIAGIAKWIE